MNQYGIFVLDDHKVIQSAVELNFKDSTTFDYLCGMESLSELNQFLNGSQKALNKYSEIILLLDIALKGSNGLDLIAIIKKQYPTIKVVLFSANDQPYFIQNGYEAGADGFFSKSESLAALEPYLKEVILGRKKAKMVSSSTVLDVFTKKEKAVLIELYRGSSYKQISADMNISQKTVEAHQANIFKKLGISTRVELIHHLQKAGFQYEF